MRVCLMIEGQEGVTWEEWRNLADVCESSAIEALFRSDHYLSVVGQADRGSLDAWATISGLAAVTTSLKLGTLVSPVTFRHPSVLAKNAVTASDIAGGERIELGLGAGWLDAEHTGYGFPFPPTGERFEMLEEQIEIIARQWTEEDLSFSGRHYELEGLNALPKPPHPIHLVVGGKAKPRSLALAARWADEYNLVMMEADEVRAAVPAVREAWESAGRDAPTISLMTGCVIGSDEADLDRRADVVSELYGSPARGQERWLVGTVEQMREQLADLEGAGVERVMLQYLPHRDLEGVELIAALAG
jgi:alkanesulfonate monooxygenase SsuD/methylene tetrahydromethanopterin reductase-like flavin-dependent oxidoreductase (luciferase family)